LACVALKPRWCRAAILSKLDIPNLGLDRQAIEFQVVQRRLGKGGNDVAATDGPLEAIKLLCRDDNGGILSVQRHALRAGALGLSDNLAQMRFRILKTPSPGPGALLGRGTSCRHAALSGQINQILEYPNSTSK
jgi:hypothetical protein